ncbi:MAG: hypothetical protein KatS3mg108_1810 [Isosphaeraceae bacterium]|jgi:ribonuclease BN (tRNA processing enzyme)|nr:MAG: hypothetical protein KatS3mg108_1810 [Isosphaeraceae bacterium]
MSEPTLVCLGCGDAFSERWYSSCLAIRARDRTLLIDCPHPIRKILREAGSAAGIRLEVEELAGLVLTHIHADHASGVEGLGYYLRYIMGRRLPLLAHPTVADELWSGQLAVTMERVGGILPDDPAAQVVGLEDYFDYISLDDQRSIQFGEFAIECRQTRHPVPTYALRITVGGRRFGYSADTAYDRELIDWLAAADLIVHEANRGIHTPYEALAALPENVRSRMRLIHYPDDFDLEASVIEPLRPGQVYAI